MLSHGCYETDVEQRAEDTSFLALKIRTIMIDGQPKAAAALDRPRLANKPPFAQAAQQPFLSASTLLIAALIVHQPMPRY
jgi:hypothetical protein